MNILILKSVDDNTIVYEYQPEGTGMIGIVSYDKKNQIVNIIKKAKDTSSDDLYASKAVNKITEFVKMKNLPIEYTQAWY
ncbi:MAG: hypothetical protein RR716_07710 [Christensenellaceae bacterium]